MTPEQLRELIHYAPETGFFTWRVASGRVSAGARAGSVGNHGYVQLQIKGQPYLAHRLAWYLTHGRMPMYEIDHINGVRTDNRLVNLREATSQQNKINVGVRVHNISGVKGVRARRRKWQARIRVDGRQIHLGYFSSKEEAAADRHLAEEKYHGEFRWSGQSRIWRAA